MYWIYQTDIQFWRNQYVQAKLMTPAPHQLTGEDCGYGFRGPSQKEPYGVDLDLTFQINLKHPHPDNYFESFGFNLFSKRLVKLLQSFDVKSEIFPVTLVDRHGVAQTQLEYFIFHSFEGVLDAMDEQKSEWKGDKKIGIPRLVIDETKFEHRPLFVCKHIYVRMMRDDVKKEIQRQGITGFGFLDPIKYTCGSYGIAPDFDS